MHTEPTPSRHRSHEAPRAAGEVVELLEVLWERGCESVAPTPVSASQRRVLYGIERAEGTNLRALGELLGAAPSSVSRLCDRLETMGFVERTRSRVSRRELTLHLTARAKAYLRDVRAQREEALLSAIDAMDPAARAALLEGLTGFRDALDRRQQRAGGGQGSPLRIRDVADARP
ncbi:MarR family winged helix-turn-helix transcriptional regulator [Streptomyces sp. NPDC059828]|uniref:MarR family winged helix-turn-helix transcriptional regulator n=1 Tax=Streptomyces sp. NPDC059828 TaxID=3346965 RepID=UPI00364F5FCB